MYAHIVCISFMLWTWIGYRIKDIDITMSTLVSWFPTQIHIPNVITGHQLATVIFISQVNVYVSSEFHSFVFSL